MTIDIAVKPDYRRQVVEDRPQIDLLNYRLMRVREDSEFILYRGIPGDARPPILILAGAKRMLSSERIERLQHEWLLGERLKSAWAVKPVCVAKLDGSNVLVLEDPGGRPLSTLLDRPLELGFLLRIAVGIAAALRQVHANGLIHKDIKPANVFVEETGNVRLTGFGFATHLTRERQSAAPPEVIAGTLAYMAPEQTGRMNRAIDSRSDLYALGTTLYEMLVGALPFAASDPMEWIYCHIARSPTPPSVRIDAPRPLEAMILKLLAKNAEERYQTAAGIEHDLRRCLQDFEAGRDIESFSIAEYDVSDRLLVPQKLYGRQREIRSLVDAFKQVATSGRFDFVLVSGYSGVGKSSVVNELQSATHLARAWFAAGKYDQYKRDIPYATLAEAFQGVLRQILSQNDAELSRWRNDLLHAVGASGQLMVDLIPEVGLIIGDQQQPPRLSGQEEKSRFHLIFRQFISVFASAEHPLVLFLDDLQWLDAATLDFLQLITDEEIPYLMLVGAYRSNEVYSTHGVGRMIESVRASRDLKEFQLAPLAVADIRQLVADAIHTDPSAAAPLADLLFQKTLGNPFFAVQFLTTLHVEGLLDFDPVRGLWNWDLERIRRKEITDNVAQLMISRLTRYEGAASAVLRHLACLGHGARTTTIAKILEVPAGEIDDALREIVGEDLIYPVERGYVFAHDGVQEAAYTLIPESERAAIHLNIGRLLSRGMSQKELEDNIFEIVNQFNRGARMVDGLAEIHRLAELNLIAGRRAKTSAAYDSALNYFSSGCELLGTNSWNDHYRTTFDLRFNQADCKFLMGEVAFAEERFEELAGRGKYASDLALIAGRQVILFTYLGRTDRALVLSIECLARLGVELPTDPSDEVVEQEYRALIERIGNREIESFVDLPPMSDPHWQEVMELLAGLLSPAGVLKADLLDLALLRMTNISLDHGNIDESCHAYANLGARVLGWRFSNVDAGHRFGQVALRLIEERGLDRYAARVYAIISGVVGPWSVPLRDCYGIAVRAIDMPRERGGIIYSGYAWVCALTALIDSGKALPDVAQHIETGLVFARKSKFSLVIEFIYTQLLFVQALRGRSQELLGLGDRDFNEAEYERKLESTPHLWHAMTRFRIRKLQLRYHSGDYDGCLQIVAKVGGTRGQSPVLGRSPVFEIVEYCFYSALARAALITGRGSDTWAQHFDEILCNHDHLAGWGARCPDNFSDRTSILGAEIARLEGRELDAERLYEQAIQSARRFGFTQNEALANELASRFYASRGFEVIAETYARNARSCYRRWGAGGKVHHLERLHPHLDEEGSSGTAALIAAGTRVHHLDLAAVIEMHQAVSREIVLDRLIERLMVTVVEHAGAVRGLLLLPRDGELRIVAEAMTDDAAVTVTLMRQNDIADQLPQSVLKYVIRSREVVMINDAVAGNVYATDAYIMRVRPRSILCLPLIKLKQVVGVLYLENGLSSHIFTQERLSFLQLLASQAAISLENAQLFLDVQQAKDQARRVGDELRLSFDLIPTLAWRASAEGAVEFVNQQWHDYTGIGDATGENWQSAFHADDVDKVASVWHRSIALGVPGECEARMRRYDGEYRRFLIRATPLRDDHGRILKWHGTNTDIENLKRAEQAQKALARVSRVTAMGELTVSIAHEVNQPLMAIVTNAATCLRWLSDGNLDVHEARLAAERIVRDGHRAGEVVASIRALAKKSSPQTGKLDLGEALLEVLLLTRNELDRNGIIVETQFGEGGAYVVGDRVQIQQVVLNIVMNAIEAIASGPVESRQITIRAAPADPGQMLVSIADTGIGMTQSDSEQIGEAFFTTKPDGIGIGLSICRSIIEGHRGRLWAIPNEPNGTIFLFTLPRFS